jgi:aspartate-semialdehyde dehydrogenase
VDPRVVIVGATGAVGKVALQVLEERSFPMSSLRLCASERSVGKTLTFRGKPITLELATEALFRESDIAFISANDQVSRDMGRLAADCGCVVIDDSAVWRMDPQVPLVIPEVNGDDVDGHQGILSIPNCSTTTMVMALWPLHRANPIRRIVVDTYQSVSGTGAAAMAELDRQNADLLAGRPTEAAAYPYQIAYNLLPHIGSFRDNGYTSEEVKMMQETRKIMHAPDIAISATCVRVPVQLCHSESVHVEFTEAMSPGEARELLSDFPGVVVTDDPANKRYPMPLEGEGKDETFVGRIRSDASNPRGLALWVVSDNLRKGAATNAVQIAEEVVRRKAWLR